LDKIIVEVIVAEHGLTVADHSRVVAAVML
jgi:hypothetical protein